MTRQEFENSLAKYSDILKQIRDSAHLLHDNVNQTYDSTRPYGFHLDMVAAYISKYGHEVCTEEKDVLPLFFGAYYHDSIEDTRETYNSVMKMAKQFMNDEQAYMATEIVYALTNDKGRTRAERAGEKYYRGIRETPYAPFVKLADRLANAYYSFNQCNDINTRMKAVYRNELPHFLEGIRVKDSIDVRFSLPEDMVTEINDILC
jgi:5'-deoxynucleotidase YfbR-like HD superfamily hydrolase